MASRFVEIHEEGDEIRYESFNGKSFCLFDLNLSMKPVKKFISHLQFSE